VEAALPAALTGRLLYNGGLRKGLRPASDTQQKRTASVRAEGDRSKRDLCISDKSRG
jgi:hypothetical protein